MALKQDRIGLLPVKAKRPSVRLRHFNYLWIEDRKGVRFTRREGRDIWQGLHELPMIETTSAARTGHLRRKLGPATFARIAGPMDHVLSHQRVRAVLWKVDPNGTALPAGWSPVKKKDIHRLAIHRLMEKLLEEVA